VAHDGVVQELPNTDRIYAGIAAGAAALALAHGPRTPLSLGCLLIALVPWGLLVAGRQLPLPAFAALAVLPVAPVVAEAGPGAALFLTTAAASRLASRSGDRRLVATTTAVVVLLPLVSFLTGHGDPGVLYFAFGDVFGVLAGALLRRSAQLAGDLRAADARLAEVAAREERQRIARDVHDLVAHSLTVVVLHVGGARRVLRRDPAAAEGALAEAERVCRESLDGIRGVVGLLREDTDRPAVSLDLGDLAATYRAAGLPVTLRTHGDLQDVPLVVRVTLHRVVQEALANAAQHAGTGAPTTVEVTADGSGVLARVANERPSPAAPPRSGVHGGHGLHGLQEQVAALGGDLSSGPRGSAWVVRCLLPTRPAAARPAPTTPVPTGTPS
jgi:signal transduction histidine kinase